MSESVESFNFPGYAVENGSTIIYTDNLPELPIVEIKGTPDDVYFVCTQLVMSGFRPLVFYYSDVDDKKKETY